MVPEVGHDAIADVCGSVDAMKQLTKRLIASGAETVVMISPHAPAEIDSFVAYQGPELYGDFSSFRAPATQMRVALDSELLETIVKNAADEDVAVVHIAGDALDHGTTVPLYFLLKNGWKGQLVALGISFLSDNDHLRFGACIRGAIDQVGRRVAFLASGDLSHRLKPQAPAGYDPSAYIFDEEIVDALRCNDPQRIIDIDRGLRKLAGECGYRSMLVAIGAGSQLPFTCDVINYEAPFGVGYLVAQLTGMNESGKGDTVPFCSEDSEQDSANDLPGLARRAVESLIGEGKRLQVQPVSGLLAERVPCFVSLKKQSGELRGCIGTVEPVKGTLAEEIIANAIGAATRDPRFSQVSKEELPDLRYSVDILFPAEPAVMSDLNPAVYGVIVEDEEGLRRGLLLPDIPGVDEAKQQVEIAARKAGIPLGKPLKLSRFRVERFREGSL